MIVFDFIGGQAGLREKQIWLPGPSRWPSRPCYRPAGRQVRPAGTGDVGDTSRLRWARAAEGQVSAARLAQLPAATTFGATKIGAIGFGSFCARDGDGAAPTATQVVYVRPGGPPVAALPATELGSPTWVPVVQSQPGWDRVLLPARPNRSTGWLYLGGSELQTAYSAYRVEINLGAFRLTVLDAGRKLGTWTVAVGARGTPTQAGHTLLLSSVAPRAPDLQSADIAAWLCTPTP